MAGFPRLAESYEFVVVGGGHAGLQAGLKASLLHYSAAILSKGPKYGRSFYAPKMDNIPGFPEGISGHKLLDLQVAALRPWGPRTGYFSPAQVTGARRTEGGYEVAFDWLGQSRTVLGKALVLAMGIVDRMPVIDGKIDALFPWANAGIVDFCVFCDGHTLPGKSVAVLGHDAFAVRTALDLLHFEPSSVELLTLGQPLLAGSVEGEVAALTAALRTASIEVRDQGIAGYDGIREKRFGVRFSDGSVRTYDKGFSGLEWYEMNTVLPRSLGSGLDASGNVRTDGDGRVLDEAGEPIPGLYCAGDQASGWNQIPESWAQAERAVIHADAEYL